VGLILIALFESVCDDWTTQRRRTRYPSPRWWKREASGWPS